MDWADDVSYSTHDIEDYVRAGLITLHELDGDREYILKELANRFQSRNVNYSGEQLDMAYEALFPPSQTRYRGDLLSEYTLQSWVSTRLTILINMVHRTDDAPGVMIDEEALYQVEVLKSLLRHYVIETPAFAAVQQGQKRLVAELFERMLEWVTHRGKALPARLQDQIAALSEDEPDSEERIRSRAIADYIAGLTERQFFDLLERLRGVPGGAVVTTWL